MKLEQRHTSVFCTNGKEFELAYNTDQDGSDFLLHILPDGKYLVGYLVPDSHCENPQTDNDYSGQIFTMHRHSSTREEMRKALGLDAGWEPNLDLIEISLEDYSIYCADEGFIGELQETTQLGVSAEEIKERICAGDFDEEIIEKYGEQLWLEGRTKGTIGDKYAVLLDIYEHSGVIYSISSHNENPDPWDTARGAACWVPSDAQREDLEALPEGERQARLMKMAESACDTYTKWCNGECYGLIIETFPAEGGEGEDDHLAVWGFIGAEYAVSSLKEEFEGLTKEQSDATQTTH